MTMTYSIYLNLSKIFVHLYLYLLNYGKLKFSTDLSENK